MQAISGKYGVNPNPMTSKVSARDKVLHGITGEYLTEDPRTYGQGSNSGDSTFQKKLRSKTFVEKKEGLRGTETIISLKNLDYCKDRTFKMEGLCILSDLIQAQDCIDEIKWT